MPRRYFSGIARPPSRYRTVARTTRIRQRGAVHNVVPTWDQRANPRIAKPQPGPRCHSKNEAHDRLMRRIRNSRSRPRKSLRCSRGCWPRAASRRKTQPNSRKQKMLREFVAMRGALGERAFAISGLRAFHVGGQKGWALFRPDPACLPPLGNQTAAALVAQMYPQPVEDDVQAVAQSN